MSALPKIKAKIVVSPPSKVPITTQIDRATVALYLNGARVSPWKECAVDGWKDLLVANWGAGAVKSNVDSVVLRYFNEHIYVGIDGGPWSVSSVCSVEVSIPLNEAYRVVEAARNR